GGIRWLFRSICRNLWHVSALTGPYRTVGLNRNLLRAGMYVRGPGSAVEPTLKFVMPRDTLNLFDFTRHQVFQPGAGRDIVNLFDSDDQMPAAVQPCVQGAYLVILQFRSPFGIQVERIEP